MTGHHRTIRSDGRGSFPASLEAGNSSRVVGLFSDFAKGVK